MTARARIRDAALRLFADHGVDSVSVRQIAELAEVSTALVLYHYGSKAELKQAVDSYAAETFAELIDFDSSAELAELFTEGEGGSLAELFARSFPVDSPLPDYLRRVLLTGDPVGEWLFRQWYDTTLRIVEAMRQAGYVAESDDPEVRAAFLVANDLGMIMLRRPIASALGHDPMSHEGLVRWASELATIYRDGLWTGRQTSTEHGTDSSKGSTEE